jgi:hexosaminidase
VSEADIVGVEAPLWAETIQTLDEIEYLAFPRLCGYAEIGWSPAAGRSWDEYKVRLGAQGPRLTALGVDFFPAPQVPWQ